MIKTYKQLFSLFLQMKLKHKVALIAVFLICFCLLISPIFSLFTTRTRSLFSDRELASRELEKVKDWLEGCSFSYKEKEGALFVSKRKWEKIRQELNVAKVLKEEQPAGFELFDTNTWIKGEKELQVLEMRALKGQLERDIAGFDNIQSATVILDLAPQKLFGSLAQKTKASVILSIQPNCELSLSQLQAISNHLSGAVRGLEANMIAISDTTGRLYKAIHEDREQELIKNSVYFLEDHLLVKIGKLLSKVMGKEHYHLTINYLPEPKGEKMASLAICVALDSNTICNENEKEKIKQELTHQLDVLVEALEGKKRIAIDWVAFDKGTIVNTSPKTAVWKKLFCIYLISSVAGLVCIYYFLRRKKEHSTSTDDVLYESMKKVDLRKLSSEIENQEPETIALMLSYLEMTRAQELLMLLPEPLQKKVLVLMQAEEE